MSGQPAKPDRLTRRSQRLSAYDYTAAGAYFVTLCTHDRTCLFGDIEEGIMRLNEYGRIVAVEWLRSAGVRSEVEIDAFVVMPNHVHGIVFLRPGDDAAGAASDVGATGRSPPRARGPSSKSLGAFVAGFKASATAKINAMRETPGVPIWQRNYYDHIIRDQRSLDAIRRYIAGNPAKWADDEENPARRAR